MIRVDSKCYFLLATKIPFELNSINRLFHRDDVILHIILKEIIKRYKNILSIILDPIYAKNTPAHEIDIENFNNYVPFSQLFIFEEVAQKISDHRYLMEEFCKNAVNFVISTADQLEERFDFQDPLYSAMQCLDPVNANSIQYWAENHQKIYDVLEIGKNIIIQLALSPETIVEQWNKMQFIVNIPVDKANVSDFWFYVLFDLSDLFNEVATFALYCLSIPHSNVLPEKKFSVQNAAKPKHKSVMKNETLNGILKTRRMLEDISKPEKWEPPIEMIRKVAKGDYYEKYKKMKKISAKK